MAESDKKDKVPPLPTDVQARIGEKLKAMYDEVVSQPVPDRFKELLSILDGGTGAATPPQPKSSQ